MERFQFHNQQTGIVLGGGSAIAQAFCSLINERYPELKLISVARDQSKKLHFQAKKYYFDYTKESGWQNLETLLYGERIHFLLNFVGSLNREGKGPEKNIQAFDYENLVGSLEINLKPLVLGVKTLLRNFVRNEPTLISSLSAKLGSINDNQLGGWYSYRISKSAQNMYMKSLSREMQRSYPQLIINSVHPGTTKSPMTAKYLKGVKHKIHETPETAENLFELWESLSPENSGEFRNWDQSLIDW